MRMFLDLFVICILLVGCGSKTQEVQNVQSTQPVKQTSGALKDCAGDPYMTNDEIIRETKQCESAGLKAEAVHCGDDIRTTFIQCAPKDIKE